MLGFTAIDYKRPFLLTFISNTHMEMKTLKYEEAYNCSFFVNYNVQQHKIFRSFFEDQVRAISDGETRSLNAK
jgi:hypothetical protein